VQVERSPFMHTLLRGRLDRPAYCALLRNLHDVYAALEPALMRHAGHAAIAPIYAPEMFRTGSVVCDLEALHGGNWRTAIAPQPACEGYVQRIDEIGRSQPHLLVAHAYVRYLGDLSGGQVLRRIVANSYGLAGDDGTAFYGFGGAEETSRLRAFFRAGLEHAGGDAAQHVDIVAEAGTGFERHAALFDQLAAAFGIEPAAAGVSAAR
jgi:heme oxygenase